MTVIEKRYEKLRAWRNARAKKEGLRPFRIFSNRVLMEIATLNPGSDAGLREVFGIGPVKAENYGKQVLKSLRA